MKVYSWACGTCRRFSIKDDNIYKKNISLHIPHGAHVGSSADAFHYSEPVVWIFAGQEGITKCVSVQQNSIVQVSRFCPNLYTSHSCNKKECRRERCNQQMKRS